MTSISRPDHQSNSNPVDGVILIDKAAGWLSLEVVKNIKRFVPRARVGHIGTLDPLATGLLPITIGEATKLSHWLSAENKRYQALIRLGISTNTWDRGGAEISRSPIPSLGREQILQCLLSFHGTIQQVPPMFSALHHQGKRLYQLARDGVEVERRSRPVFIQKIELLGYGDDWIELDVICGSGTYIRSLAVDVAKKLGTDGHLAALTRTESAGFDLAHAKKIEQIDRQSIINSLIPLEVVLARYPCIKVSHEEACRLAKGQHLSLLELRELCPIPSHGADFMAWFYSPDFAPIILARLCLREADQPAGMKILRVLRPNAVRS